MLLLYRRTLLYRLPIPLSTCKRGLYLAGASHRGRYGKGQSREGPQEPPLINIAPSRAERFLWHERGLGAAHNLLTHSTYRANHLCAEARRGTTATSKAGQIKNPEPSGRGAKWPTGSASAHREQTRRQGVLGVRLAKARHPASGGAAARARARETALPVAAAAAVGARSSAAPVGTRAARAVAAAVTTARQSDADAAEEEAAHRPDRGFRRRVAAEEAAHGRSVATR